MGHPVESRARCQRLGRDAREGLAELGFHKLEEFFHSDLVDDVFQARLETVGPVAGVDENPHDRVCNFGGVGRLDDDAGFLGEILVPGDTADAETKPHAGLDAEAVLHLNSGEGDVVGVFQHRDLSRAVERDVELARQAVKRTIVENMKVPFARIFAGVDQFLRIDARRRRARDVADVVGAGTARAQAKILNTLDQRHRVLRRNFTDLKIGAGRDMAKRTAQFLGEIGKPCELPVLENAVGNAQAAHIGVLRRGDVEQAVIAPAKIVGRRWRRVGQRLLLEPRIGIEGMLLALELLLVDELFARGQNLVLRLDVRGLRANGLGIGLRAATQAAPDLADLQAGRETFEVTLLLVGKLDGEGVDLHGSQRSSCCRNVRPSRKGTRRIKHWFGENHRPLLHPARPASLL